MAKGKNTLNKINIGGVAYGQGASTPANIAASLVLNEALDELDGTVQGDTFHKPFGGLGNGSVTINFKFETDMSPLVTLNALSGEVTILWKLDGSAATSSTNQEATIKCQWINKIPFGGEPGSAFEASVTQPLTTATAWAS
jgi:hypothetical protein